MIAGRVIRAGLAELVVLTGQEVVSQHALYQESDPDADYYDGPAPDVQDAAEVEGR